MHKNQNFGNPNNLLNESNNLITSNNKKENNQNANIEISNINSTTDKNSANKLSDHYDDLNPDFKISEINSHRVSVEYLKNILLKYLEAIAIGNEFQIKILENVIFSILKIPNNERLKLEDKRNRSSFYFNLWHNAKSYLAAKIYGNQNDFSENIENPNNPVGLNFEMNKDFINAIQGNNTNASNLNTEIIQVDKEKRNNNDNLDKELNGEDLDIDI